VLLGQEDRGQRGVIVEEALGRLLEGAGDSARALAVAEGAWSGGSNG